MTSVVCVGRREICSRDKCCGKSVCSCGIKVVEKGRGGGRDGDGDVGSICMMLCVAGFVCLEWETLGYINMNIPSCLCGCVGVWVWLWLCARACTWWGAVAMTEWERPSQMHMLASTATLAEQIGCTNTGRHGQCSCMPVLHVCTPCSFAFAWTPPPACVVHCTPHEHTAFVRPMLRSCQCFFRNACASSRGLRARTMFLPSGCLS